MFCMSAPSKPKLERTLGLFEVVLSGVGIILGAGIYALIGKAAALGGNGIWLSFVIAAVVASFTGLSYAELSSMFPKSGAEYVYTKSAFGKKIAFIIGWALIIGGVFSASTVALGFGGYLNAITNFPVIFGAIILLLLSAFVLFLGVKESARAAIIGTFIEAGGLILIIAIGIPHFGSVDYLDIPDLSGVVSAAALIFFAYLGFEEISRMSGETKNPTKVIPTAIIISIVITTILYILVAISSVSILPASQLASSNAPLADVASEVLGPSAHFILSIIALFSTANTVLMMQFATSRLAYGISDKYKPLTILRSISKNHTPYIAIILVTIASIIFLFFGEISLIAYLTDFTVFLAFIVVNLSLIYLRYREPKLKRPFKVPTILIPLFGAISSFLIMLTIPFDILIYGVLMVLIGIPVYYFSNR